MKWATVVGDYALMCSLAALWDAWLGGECLTPALCAASILTLNVPMIARDLVHMRVFRDRIAAAKLRYRPTALLVREWAKVIGYTMAILYGLRVLGLVHFARLTPATAAACYAEFLVMSAAKDATCMAWVHRWMHESAPWWIHKDHHSTGAEVSVLNLWHFSLLDLTIENSSALPILFLVQWAAGLPVGVHLLSYYLLAWLDVTSHSANPHTACFLNPVLDHVFKVAVAHNLHHASIATGRRTGHYTICPVHHISGAARAADVAAYNRAMGTDFVL